jgi:hypothetical protein
VEAEVGGEAGVRWLWISVGSILYWFCAFWGMLFVGMAHGDCWTGQGHGTVQGCLDQKRVVLLSYVVVAVALYVFAVWRVSRRR